MATGSKIPFTENEIDTSLIKIKPLTPRHSDSRLWEKYKPCITRWIIKLQINVMVNNYASRESTKSALKKFEA